MDFTTVSFGSLLREYWARVYEKLSQFNGVRYPLVGGTGCS